MAFDTELKSKEFISVCRKLNYNQRIIFSDEGNLSSRCEVEVYEQENKPKPYGLWYSIGPAWIEFLTDEYSDLTSGDWAVKRFESYKSIHELKLRLQSICRIQNIQEFDNFTKRYSCKEQSQIQWSRVKRDGWRGVEIEWLEQRDDVPWYNGWDCSSGCIWDRKAIFCIEKIKSWD